MAHIYLVVFYCIVECTLSLDNGLGLLPQMGFNSWYAFGCKVNQTVIQETALKFVALGLDKLGYEYINIDGCWAGDRYPNGTIYGHTPQFNKSLKGLADYVHSYNLKFGLYTDRGNKTCGGRPGSFGYEQIDAQTYALWGVDYLKEDSCNASGEQLVAFSEYARMRDALNATNRKIFYSLCGWKEWYSSMGMSLANSWRISVDDATWLHILKNIDTNAQYELHQYSGPGGWNDPCLLLGDGNHAAITELQSRSQFSMWSVMAAPLLISSDIRNISSYNLATYTNKYVIGVNQDKSGKQGIRIQGNNLLLSNGSINVVNCTNIWSRELIDGSRAMVFLNVHPTNSMNITCDAVCFNNAGFYYGVGVTIYDIWNDNKFIRNISTSKSFVVNVGPDAVKMYKMVPFYDQYPSNKQEI